MKYPPEAIDIRAFDGLFSEEIMLHKAHATRQLNGQFFSSQIADFETILHYTTQTRKLSSKCNTNRSMRASHVYDDPVSKSAPIEAVQDVNGFQAWTSTEPRHCSCITCFTLGVLGEFFENGSFGTVCDVETLKIIKSEVST